VFILSDSSAQLEVIYRDTGDDFGVCLYGVCIFVTDMIYVNWNWERPARRLLQLLDG